jgi:hypothetical protein
MKLGWQREEASTAADGGESLDGDDDDVRDSTRLVGDRMMMNEVGGGRGELGGLHWGERKYEALFVFEVPLLLVMFNIVQEKVWYFVTDIQ